MGTRHMFYRDLFKEPTRIIKGEGVYVYDQSGKRFLDTTGGSNASSLIGHGVKQVIDAMLEQTLKISFVPMHLFSNEPAERLADELAKIAPPNLATTWSVNSGSVGGHTFRRSKYMPLLKEMPHIPPAYCYRCWFNKDYPDCDIDCAMFLERVVKQEGAECVAAFIAEPIVGATTGATTPPKEYYPIIRETCDTYDLTFIADEVQTGI